MWKAVALSALVVAPLFSAQPDQGVVSATSVSDWIRVESSRLHVEVFAYATNLETGRSFGCSDEQPVAMASTVKLPIVATVFNEVAHGRARWDEVTLLDRGKVVSPASRGG